MNKRTLRTLARTLGLQLGTLANIATNLPDEQHRVSLLSTIRVMQETLDDLDEEIEA